MTELATCDENRAKQDGICGCGSEGTLDLLLLETDGLRSKREAVTAYSLGSSE